MADEIASSSIVTNSPAKESLGEKIEQGLETAGKDCEKVIEDVVTVDGKVGKVIDTLVADEPEFKTTLKTVLTDGLAVGAQVSTCVNQKGLSLADDAELLAKVQAFFTTDVMTLLAPLVEKLYGEIKTDVQ